MCQPNHVGIQQDFSRSMWKLSNKHKAERKTFDVLGCSTGAEFVTYTLKKPQD